MIVVALDPGHGGEDHGVVAGNEWDRVVEKDYVLDLALNLSLRLGHLPGVTAPLTREDDRNLGLTEAAKTARELLADLAVLIHVNRFEDPAVHGLLAFHWPGDWRGADVAGRIVACSPAPLIATSPRGLQSATTERWPRVVNVMRPFWERGITPVLVETFCASSNTDRAFAVTEHGKHAIANAIEAGVIRFLEIVEDSRRHAP